MAILPSASPGQSLLWLTQRQSDRVEYGEPVFSIDTQPRSFLVRMPHRPAPSSSLRVIGTRGPKPQRVMHGNVPDHRASPAEGDRAHKNRRRRRRDKSTSSTTHSARRLKCRIPHYSQDSSTCAAQQFQALYLELFCRDFHIPFWGFVTTLPHPSLSPHFPHHCYL
jgi:hypothetical protein